MNEATESLQEIASRFGELRKSFDSLRESHEVSLADKSVRIFMACENPYSTAWLPRFFLPQTAFVLVFSRWGLNVCSICNRPLGFSSKCLWWHLLFRDPQQLRRNVVDVLFPVANTHIDRAWLKPCPCSLSSKALQGIQSIFGASIIEWGYIIFELCWQMLCYRIFTIHAGNPPPALFELNIVKVG